MHFDRILGIVFGVLLTTISLWPFSAAATSFPYTLRTQNYSAWSPAAQSDTNTTGMAGATVALPSSISAAEINPAGFAMETGSVSAQINSISIVDRQIQPDGQEIDSSQWGLGVSPPPWGFSISYYSPITESDTYYSNNVFAASKTEVSLKELRFTVAHTFFDSRLALAFSAELDKAVRELGAYSYDSYAPSFALGALYRAYAHVVFGASYIPPLIIRPSGGADNPELPGFNQAVLRPSQLNFGAGWVPNRFFKVGLSLSYVGDTANTALLSNQAVVTGATPTWVPRLGASYVLAQFANFSSELAMGSYYAASRFEGDPSRVHATTGWDINPYFINIGLGFDLSSEYHNVMIGVGIDIVRTARTFNIIPKDPTPPLNGFFPRATEVVADGLPDAMTHGEAKTTSPPTLGDVGQIVKDVAPNIVDKIEGKPTSVEKSAAQQQTVVQPPAAPAKPRKHRKGKGKSKAKNPVPSGTPSAAPPQSPPKPSPAPTPAPLGNGGSFNMSL